MKALLYALPVTAAWIALQVYIHRAAQVHQTRLAHQARQRWR